jgi:hypothetical protein
MRNTIHTFDFAIDIGGARVILLKEPLCSGCLSGGEVDAQIELLKENLDAVAIKMKKAIRDLAKQPFDLETQ